MNLSCLPVPPPPLLPLWPSLFLSLSLLLPPSLPPSLPHSSIKVSTLSILTDNMAVSLTWPKLLSTGCCNRDSVMTRHNSAVSADSIFCCFFLLFSLTALLHVPHFRLRKHACAVSKSAPPTSALSHADRRYRNLHHGTAKLFAVDS